MQDAQRTMPFTFINHLRLFKGREQLFVDICHFGDIGNQIIAEDLLRELKPMISEIAAKRSQVSKTTSE